MTSVALQRVLVRMLYDPLLVAAVHDDAARALADCTISSKQLAWLRGADRRAFAIDPHRRGRSLVALFDEYPVSCALFVRQGNGVEALDAFFSSAIFHSGMQAGESLAELFGQYLQLTLGSELALGTREVLRLEQIVAQLRRRRGHASRRWSFADRTGLLTACTLNLHDYAAAALQLRGAASLAEAILDTTRQLPTLHLSEAVNILVFAHETARLEALPQDIGLLLQAIDEQLSATELRALTLRLGASADDLEELLRELATDGVLLPPTST